MALADITTTGWILALLKRDDDQTLLLGSGAYDFKESQQHFTPNTYANDVVELQGTDGQLLTGQVRRSTAQSFDGFVGEAGMTRAEIEQYRRQFLMFFRRGHKYTVIYIFPDGTAIKRGRGYIVDAPSVPELYQILPEYHVALAFEDVNYYSYAEDSSGNETFAFNAHLNLSDVQGGGLKWDANGAISSPTGLGNIRINGDTFQQTYTGKNLYTAQQSREQSGVTLTLNSDGTYSLSGTASANVNFINYTNLSDALISQGDQLAFSSTKALPSGVEVRYEAYDGSTWKRHIVPYLYSERQTSTTESANLSGATRIRQNIYIANGADSTISNFGIQLEKAAEPTSYEPYVGGQASPNPDFPQPVQTVTGQQTVTINGADYTLDLGAIELCKLSTYQDYIWKDGEDWKVHKAIGSNTFDGTETWSQSGDSTTTVYTALTNLISTGLSYAFVDHDLSKMDRFHFINGIATPEIGAFKMVTNSSGVAQHLRLMFDKATISTAASAKAWIAANKPKLYAVLYTPTDTTITDATLIAQLNAIEEAMGADGQPTAIVPTGDSLAAIITGEPNGTGGYEWAAASGGGPTFITVTGIDDAQPVWKVVGPATNPTLTNSTSGVSITWNGTVPNNQTLIVDMGAQTATLEGANVFAFISGSWLTLEPGTNRIAYTAGNTTNGCDIYWNEIVG